MAGIGAAALALATSLWGASAPGRPPTADTAAAPVVVPDAGPVRGARSEGVESFKGIPYALPPVGPLRWHAPVPVKRWTAVRDATRYGHDCMQLPFPSDAAPLGTEPAEDCLVLNVWRPAALEPRARRPVLVWIHGGGLVNGGSSPDVYDGSAFARQGIVFVSFNYRLGRFGFFAHPALANAHEGPIANWGFLDQRAALEWVQRNIARFGGDPARVTIMGESSGGISVMNLVGVPADRHLFARAIVMSGAGRIAPARDIALDLPGTPSAETIGRRFADSVGVIGTGPAALARLRALPADRIVAGLNLATIFAGDVATFSGQYADGITVTGTNQHVFARHAQAPVPIMVGTTSADISQLRATTRSEALAPFGPDAAAAAKAYDPDGRLDAKTLAARIGSDLFMLEPARYIARMMTTTGHPSFLYRFSYVAASQRANQPAGAPHASDIPFFFDTVAAKYRDRLTPLDAAMARAVNRYVVAFVRAARLLPSGLAVAGAPDWRPFRGKGPLMDFTASGTTASGADPWQDRLDLVQRANSRNDLSTR